MEVPAGQDGIQRLLAAEQEAQAIVAKARKGESVRVLACLLESMPRPENHNGVCAACWWLVTSPTALPHSQ